MLHILYSFYFLIQPTKIAIKTEVVSNELPRTLRVSAVTKLN